MNDRRDYGTDKLHEECGVFGAWSSSDKNIAHLIGAGLMALQHRGQESAGISVCDTTGIFSNSSTYKNMGLVSEVFTEDVLGKLHGNIGIGHVRYSTAGASCVENAQPFSINYLKGTMALAHNGNINNIDKMREDLQLDGAVFSGTSDSEVIAYSIAKESMTAESLEAAVAKVVPQLKGGYAILVLCPRKIVAVRDPYGIKPLCLGKTEQGYVLASESAAIHSVGAEFIRDIKPGEMVIIDSYGVRSVMLSAAGREAHCVFEYIYFARLDSKLDGINVYDARIAGGRALAERYPVEADVVTGVPESGLTAAVGYSEASGIPFKLAFSKNSYVGRTFIKPTQQERESAVHMKLNLIESVVKGKRVVLIDDSIVRGTTIANLITMMRKAGALEVHVRISSPPFLYPCFYGTDVPDNSQLIANECSEEEIRDRIGADSLGYMQLDDLKKMTGELGICSACFDNNYPV